MGDLTVFVISCGNNPNLPDCVDALNRLSTPVSIERIHNVAPMSAAFQQMLDKCKTPLFVQVDEDMILHPDAVERMRSAILESDGRVGFMAFRLRDVHLNLPIYGVKVYRHAIMSQFPYNLDTISCEVEQFRRMEQAGYRYLVREDIVGDHSPQWTNELIFERYFDLMEKWKRFGYDWLEDLPRRLHSIYAAFPTSVNWHALQGALASISSTEPLRDREKSFRRRGLEWIRLRSWMSRPWQATLYLTSRCNFRCPFCLRQGDGRPPEVRDMEPGLVDKLAARFPSIVGACLCGFGEPLLHPDPAAIIRRCRDVGLRCVSLITNGSLLVDRIAELERDPPDFVSVSLNASNAVGHAQQTGVPGMWDKVVSGIKAAKKAGIPVYLSRVCQVSTLGDLQAFLELAQSLNVRAVMLHNLLPLNLGTQEELQGFLQEVLTVKHADTLASFRSLPGSELVVRWPTLLDLESPRQDCSFPFHSLAIDGEGNVSVCNSIAPPSPANGNISDAKIWHSPYCESVRGRFAGAELPVSCRYCFRNYEPAE